MGIEGKTVVITGATSGLGQGAAIDFAKAGAKVLIVGRDAARAKETQAQAGPNSDVIIGDVSTRAGIKAVAQAILAKAPKIDVLLNNAGGQFKTLTKTADGIETTFALNTFGAYLLERELHAAISAAKGRVVNVVTGFLNSFPVDPDDLADPKKFASLGAYAKSKHASVMMSVEQAKRYEPEGIKVEAVHPGIIMGTRFGGGQPKIAQAIGGPIMRAIGMACTLDEAVRRFRVACFDELPSGSYLVKGQVAELPKQVNDAAVRAKVYGLLEKLAAA
jgi:NAD(P)-dependent dehydrogenase (short-subunit alcohol dehydrogenase family)